MYTPISGTLIVFLLCSQMADSAPKIATSTSRLPQPRTGLRKPTAGPVSRLANARGTCRFLSFVQVLDVLYIMMGSDVAFVVQLLVDRKVLLISLKLAPNLH